LNNKNVTPSPEPWVNLEDVAKHLKVSQDTIRQWIKKGKIPYSRAGKQYKFRLSVVDEWVLEGKIAE
jgi:excisionase family DNA binding protein